MHIYKKEKYPGYKTERQWALDGMLPTKNALGEKMWTNGYRGRQCTYFAPNEVEAASADQLSEYFKPEREHRNKLDRARRQEKKQEKLAAAERAAKEAEEMKIREAIRPYLKRISELNGICRTIVIDTELTGLKLEVDELLQVSIVDINGNILFNSYFKPYVDSWKESEEYHHITPEMVENAPRITDKIPELNEILYSAEKIIGYNTIVDLNFLKKSGVFIPENAEIVDVQEDFAPIYGERDLSLNPRGYYKWQKLTTCADYYGYSFKAHDSLEDAKATLFCYNKIMDGKR